MSSDHPAETEEQFSRAKALLQDLIGSREILRELELDGSANAQQVYTHAATLFGLTLQRLGGGLTLKETARQMVQEHRELLRQDNRRVRQGTLSESASGFDKARRSLPLSKVAAFCQTVCQKLADDSGTILDGKRIYVVDGTTIALPPTKDLAEHFPPARNQYGQTPWPIMNMLVAHELDSSCCLVPEIAPMYGSKNAGEITLLKRMIAERIPEDSILMGDAGVGVFAAAFHCRQNAHRFIFALTAQRFRSHVKKATCIDQGDGYASYEYVWKPTSKERKSHPEIEVGAAIHVILHRIELGDDKFQYLVTDLQYDTDTMGKIYRRRYDCEFDIRDLKVTMDTENMRARSHDTIMKELYGSILAYNLVVQFRRNAAKRRGLHPRRLSFSDTWLEFRYGLLRKNLSDVTQWQAAYEEALSKASRCVLPDRRGKRSYPRVSYQKRPKTTKFEKLNRAQAAEIREEKRKTALE